MATWFPQGTNMRGLAPWIAGPNYRRDKAHPRPDIGTFNAMAKFQLGRKKFEYER
jgi:hypothetical protein